MSERRFDSRAFGIIAGATLLGAAWAGYQLWTAGFGSDQGNFRALIWGVFATPFAAFCGWAWARPGERWQAAFVCFVIYFFSILVAARIERLVLGEERAAATGHALYFQLTLALDLIACLVVALRQARSVGTIPLPNDAVGRTTPPKP